MKNVIIDDQPIVGGIETSGYGQVPSPEWQRMDGRVFATRTCAVIAVPDLIPDLNKSGQSISGNDRP